jgi:hypothetical protein
MTDLIDRLRAGETGPELDLEIHRAITGVSDWRFVWPKNGDMDWQHNECRRLQAVPYTTSIDAAMTLFPKGWRADISNGEEGNRKSSDVYTFSINGESPEYAPTLPAAICMACLNMKKE